MCGASRSEQEDSLVAVTVDLLYHAVASGDGIGVRGMVPLRELFTLDSMGTVWSIAEVGECVCVCVLCVVCVCVCVCVRK